MVFLSQFIFPGGERESDFLMGIKRTCYNSYYPFQVLTNNQEKITLNFEPITILYGGNGSGKTTALNVMAEKLKLNRNTLFNRTNFFEDYENICTYEIENEIPERSRIITSDDVFDFMLNLRTLNEGIHVKREDLFEEYLDKKYSAFQLKSIDDYDNLKKVNQARKSTQSKYISKNVMDNVREHSNGESARFFRCQFVIATHSPFILSLKDAKIYDLDAEPVKMKRWTELPNVREYYSFFREHKDEFESEL